MEGTTARRLRDRPWRRDFVKAYPHVRTERLEREARNAVEGRLDAMEAEICELRASLLALVEALAK